MRSNRFPCLQLAAAAQLVVSLGWLHAVARPGLVQASCAVAAPAQVLWTYPETGATDVPTDAVFWAVLSLGAPRPKASLDGQPLVVEDAGSFGGVRMDPGPLAPSSDHVLALELELAANSPAGGPLRVEIAFRTAATASPAAPQAPVVSGHALREGKPADHPCADVINAQDCFDTGQSTFLSFHAVQLSDTVGWTIKGEASALWPARCGEPTVYTHTLSQPTARVCYQLRRIAAGGQLSPPVEHCIEPSAPTGAAGAAAASQAPAVADSGCAAVGGAGDRAACSITLGLLWLWSRRVGRRHKLGA